MIQATAEIKLTCPDCQRENESARIYCHDCGARLDRSGLAKKKDSEEDPRETQRRLKTMFDSKQAALRRRFFLVSKTILIAFIVAGLVQMLRPADLPPRSQEAMAEMPAQINLDLENATFDPRVGPLRYTEAQINAYLAYALKSKQTALSKYLKFERLVLGLEEGRVLATAERSFYGFAVSASAYYHATLQDGKLILKNQGGQLGRVPVHPLLMQFSDILFADLKTALERERKTIVKLAAVELHPKLVVFVPKQAPTAL